MDETTKNVILQPVKLCASAKVNVLSIKALLSQGFNLTKDSKNKIMTSVDSKKINMHRWIKTQNGWVSDVDIFSGTGCTIFNMSWLPNFHCKRYANVNVLHALLGHLSEGTTRLMATEMDVMVTGIFQPCNNFVFGKAKKADVSKTINNRSNLPGLQHFIDISLSTETSSADRAHWLLIVDDCTDYTWTYFLKEKRKLPDKLNELMNEVKAKYNIQVKKIWCDNADRNYALEVLKKKREMELLLHTQHLAYLSKMVVLSKNLQCCWLSEILGHASCGLRLQILQLYLKTALSRLDMRWVLFNNFLEGRNKNDFIIIAKIWGKCITKQEKS